MFRLGLKKIFRESVDIFVLLLTSFLPAWRVWSWSRFHPSSIEHYYGLYLQSYWTSLLTNWQYLHLFIMSTKSHPHRTESYASLCETAKLISSALDGATERAVLCANDGTILYMNPASDHFLCQTSSKHVTDVLVCDDWLTVKHCKVIMKSGLLTTRNDRNITITKLDDVCPCCTRQYYTIYICSRHGKKTKCCLGWRQTWPW